MVVKLTGVIEGNPVIFERKSGDVWETTIPAKLNGIYIVELTAVDEAGNIAYCAKYIVTVDLSALCVHLEPFPWKSELLDESYNAKCEVSNYFAKLERTEYAISVELSKYYAEIMENKCGGAA